MSACDGVLSAGMSAELIVHWPSSLLAVSLPDSIQRRIVRSETSK